MSLAAPPAPSWVLVALDTTPPVVAVAAEPVIDPPADWQVLLRANEALGPCSASFLDEAGRTHSVGLERPAERSLRAVLPTSGVGSGVLRVVLRDLACNPVVVLVNLLVNREPDYEATLAIERFREVSMSVDYAYEVEIRVRHGHTTALTVDHAHEVDGAITHAFDVTLEITDGQQ